MVVPGEDVGLTNQRTPAMPIYHDPALYPEAIDETDAGSTFLAFAEGTITWPSLGILGQAECSCPSECARDHERD